MAPTLKSVVVVEEGGKPLTPEAIAQIPAGCTHVTARLYVQTTVVMGVVALINRPEGLEHHAIAPEALRSGPHHIDGGHCSCLPEQDAAGVWVHKDAPGRKTA